MFSTLTISPARWAGVLTSIVVCLTLASFAVQFCKFILGHDVLFGFIRLLDVNTEGNIPTWYSTLALLTSSLLLAAIASTKKNGHPYFFSWTVLSIIFLFLSVDEGAGLHELWTPFLLRSFDARGFIYFVWVVPYGILVLIFALAYLNFLVHLPVKTRNLFLAAGVIFVSGALGMELIEGRYADSFGERNMGMAVLTTVEEFLEMIGIVVFIYALLSHLSSEMKGIRICIRTKDQLPNTDNGLKFYRHV